MFSVLRAGAIVNLSIWSSSWLTNTHLKLIKKLRNPILPPILTPTIFNQPTSLSISHIPANQLDSLASGESLVSWVDLIEALLVDEEITVDGNDGQDGAIVEDFLLDVLELFGDAVVGNFVFLTVSGLFLAFLWGWESGVVAEAWLLDEAVDFGIV